MRAQGLPPPWFSLFALLLASLPRCAGLFNFGALFTPSTKGIKDSLEGLCKPEKVPTSEELTILHEVSTVYFKNVENQTRDAWSCECIFRGWGMKTAYVMWRLRNDLILLSHIIGNCTPESPVTRTKQYAELTEGLETCSRQLGEFFAYHILSYGAEQLLHVRSGTSKHFTWSSVEAIPLPEGDDFTQFTEQLQKKYPKLSAIRQNAYLAQVLAAIDSPKILQKVLTAKDKEMHQLADYHRDLAGYLWETRTVRRRIERRPSYQTNPSALEACETLEQLEEVLRSVLQFIFLYKGILNADVVEIDVAKHGKEVSCVDARNSISMEDPAYHAVLALAFHMSAPEPEGSEMLKLHIANCAHEYQKRLDHVHRLNDDPASIVRELRVIIAVAKRLAKIVSTFTTKGPGVSSPDLSGLGDLAGKASTLVVEQADRTLIKLILAMHSEGSPLAQLSTSLDRMTPSAGEPMVQYVSRLEASLSTYDQVVEDFFFLYGASSFNLHYRLPRAGADGDGSADIVPKDDEELLLILRTVGYKCLKLRHLRATIAEQNKLIKPTLPGVYEKTDGRMKRMELVFFDVLRVLLRLKHASSEFIHNFTVEGPPLVIRNPTSDEEKIVFDAIDTTLRDDPTGINEPFRMISPTEQPTTSATQDTAGSPDASKGSGTVDNGGAASRDWLTTATDPALTKVEPASVLYAQQDTTHQLLLAKTGPLGCLAMVGLVLIGAALGGLVMYRFRPRPHRSVSEIDGRA